MQYFLWDIGDEAIQRSLSKRRDLIDELSIISILDDRLIASWTQTERKDPDLLHLAIENAKTDTTFIQLITQSNLDSVMAEKLAKRVSPKVGWYLLTHPKLSNSTAEKLIASYILSQNSISDKSWYIFEERLGVRYDLWAAAVNNSNLDNIPIIQYAAKKSIFDSNLRNCIINALVRIDKGDVYSNTNTIKYSEQIISELLRSPYLTKIQLTQLRNLNLSKNHYDVLELRIKSDLFANLSALTCSSDPDNPKTISIESHVKSLVAIASESTSIVLPADLVAYEALLHREHLTPYDLDKLLAHSRGISSRELAKRLELEGRLLDLVELSKYMGIFVLDDLLDKSPIYALLSEEGSVEINDRTVTDSLRDVVIDHYRPLSKVINQPNIISSIIGRLEDLERDVSETAISLLGEWEGNLKELIITASALKY